MADKEAAKTKQQTHWQNEDMPVKRKSAYETTLIQLLLLKKSSFSHNKPS